MDMELPENPSHQQDILVVILLIQAVTHLQHLIVLATKLPRQTHHSWSIHHILLTPLSSVSRHKKATLSTTIVLLALRMVHNLTMTLRH